MLKNVVFDVMDKFRGLHSGSMLHRHREDPNTVEIASVTILGCYKDEHSNLFSSDLCKMHGFNPFCEILYGSDNEFMTIGRRRVNLAYEIESPLTKGPRRRNWLKFLRWRMYEVSMNLTLLTFLDKLI